jgi:hypothetical protein
MAGKIKANADKQKAMSDSLMRDQSALEAVRRETGVPNREALQSVPHRMGAGSGLKCDRQACMSCWSLRSRPAWLARSMPEGVRKLQRKSKPLT